MATPNHSGPSAAASSVSTKPNPTLARCALRIVRLYRSRARTALVHARAAKDRGNQHALRGYAHEALLWRNFANDWSRKARGAQS